MKIITFKYNRAASAIQKSSLMSDEAYACKDMYKLAPMPVDKEYISHAQSKENRKKYDISET